jgi:hypothetical protein
MIGAVRYVALQHDETTVFCYARNEKNVRSFYSDDPSIKLQIVGLDGPFNYTPSDFTNVYASGAHARIWDYTDFPNCFYDHMKMDRGIRYSYFHIPISAKASELYESVRTTPYIFVQTVFLGNNGGGVVNSFLTWNINETLTLDPNSNLYSEGHVWYDLAQSFVNHPFSEYIELIKHAKEIHVVNSSFYCLAAHLPLDALVKKCYLRETGDYDPKWSFRPV